MEKKVHHLPSGLPCGNLPDRRHFFSTLPELSWRFWCPHNGPKNHWISHIQWAKGCSVAEKSRQKCKQNRMGGWTTRLRNVAKSDWGHHFPQVSGHKLFLKKRWSHHLDHLESMDFVIWNPFSSLRSIGTELSELHGFGGKKQVEWSPFDWVQWFLARSFFADSSTKPFSMSGFRKSAQNGGKRSAAQTPPLAFYWSKIFPRLFKLI